MEDEEEQEDKEEDAEEEKSEGSGRGVSSCYYVEKKRAAGDTWARVCCSTCCSRGR